MGYTSFEDLEVWKRSARLAVKIYDALRDCRDYGLKDQMTRAAVSIASNIAEGAERDSGLNSYAFCTLPRVRPPNCGLRPISPNVLVFYLPPMPAPLLPNCKEISSMLHGLITSLKLKSLEGMP
jgi:23S rRNA-intervening sequence protein